MRKLLVSTAAALALACVPAIASAQQAAPARSAEIQPANEDVTGSELKKSGYILPLILVIGIIAALYLLIDDNEQDFPTSP